MGQGHTMPTNSARDLLSAFVVQIPAVTVNRDGGLLVGSLSLVPAKGLIPILDWTGMETHFLCYTICQISLIPLEYPPYRNRRYNYQKYHYSLVTVVSQDNC